jgi:hypothetical protein
MIGWQVNDYEYTRTKHPCVKRDSNPKSQHLRNQGLRLRLRGHWDQLLFLTSVTQWKEIEQGYELHLEPPRSLVWTPCPTQTQQQNQWWVGRLPASRSVWRAWRWPKAWSLRALKNEAEFCPLFHNNWSNLILFNIIITFSIPALRKENLCRYLMTEIHATLWQL